MSINCSSNNWPRGHRQSNDALKALLDGGGPRCDGSHGNAARLLLLPLRGLLFRIGSRRGAAHDCQLLGFLLHAPPVAAGQEQQRAAAHGAADRDGRGAAAVARRRRHL